MDRRVSYRGILYGYYLIKDTSRIFFVVIDV